MTQKQKNESLKTESDRFTIYTKRLEGVRGIDTGKNTHKSMQKYELLRRLEILITVTRSQYDIFLSQPIFPRKVIAQKKDNGSILFDLPGMDKKEAIEYAKQSIKSVIKERLNKRPWGWKYKVK